MLSSSSSPCLSGRLHRELNETERDETDIRTLSLSVKIQPVDALQENKDKEMIDIRSFPEIA